MVFETTQRMLQRPLERFSSTGTGGRRSQPPKCAHAPPPSSAVGGSSAVRPAPGDRFIGSYRWGLHSPLFYRFYFTVVISEIYFATKLLKSAKRWNKFSLKREINFFFLVPIRLVFVFVFWRASVDSHAPFTEIELNYLFLAEWR